MQTMLCQIYDLIQSVLSTVTNVGKVKASVDVTDTELNQEKDVQLLLCSYSASFLDLNKAAEHHEYIDAIPAMYIQQRTDLWFSFKKTE